MAVFPKFKITNKGLDLLNRSIAEKKALTFTKFKIGNGVPTGNWEELNDIVSKFKEFPVLETSVQPNKIVRVKGYFDNKGLTQDYLLKEIGVYAMLEGIAGEILYSYTNAGDTADTIPDENNGFFSRTFDVANYISNATQITFQVLENRFDFNFNTIEEMRNATFLKTGDRLHLWGKTQLGDTTTKTLIVTDTYNGSNDKYTLKNNKIAVVINDIDNKLDKGTYQGNAQDLKNEITGKQNKIDINLILKEKNIVDNINKSFHRVIPKQIGEIGSNTLADFRMVGHFYGSVATGVQWTDLPKGITEKSFEMYVGSALPLTYDDKEHYCSQRIKNRNSEREFIRGWSNGLRPWSEILNTSSPMYLGHIGLSQFKTIQETGEKTPPNVYIDDETGKPYRCLIRNNDEVPTNNFEPIDNNSLFDNGFEYGTQVINGETWEWQLNKKTKILEQWALITVSSYSTKTLPKAYTNKNFLIIANSGNMSSNSMVSAQGETNNTFSIKTTASGDNKTYVYAKGIIGG